jgi:hypothetical protein
MPSPIHLPHDPALSVFAFDSEAELYDYLRQNPKTRSVCRLVYQKTEPGELICLLATYADAEICKKAQVAALVSNSDRARTYQSRSTFAYRARKYNTGTLPNE